MSLFAVTLFDRSISIDCHSKCFHHSSITTSIPYFLVPFTKISLWRWPSRQRRFFLLSFELLNPPTPTHTGIHTLVMKCLLILTKSQRVTWSQVHNVSSIIWFIDVSLICRQRVVRFTLLYFLRFLCTLSGRESKNTRVHNLDRVKIAGKLVHKSFSFPCKYLFVICICIYVPYVTYVRTCFATLGLECPNICRFFCNLSLFFFFDDYANMCEYLPCVSLGFVIKCKLSPFKRAEGIY